MIESTQGLSHNRGSFIGNGTGGFIERILWCSKVRDVDLDDAHGHCGSPMSPSTINLASKDLKEPGRQGGRVFQLVQSLDGDREHVVYKVSCIGSIGDHVRSGGDQRRTMLGINSFKGADIAILK